MAGLREQDQFMPIANVIRIMRRILPAHAKISDDAKETMQDCVSEFISFITSEANERCQREQRKTVTAEDVIWAMGKLGFDDYIQPLSLYLQKYRDSEGEPAFARRNPAPLSVMPPPPPPPQPQPQPQPPSAGFYGYYGFGPMNDFDPSQGFYRDDASASAVGSASASASASASGSSVATFGSFPHLKGDPM